ncbi:MAG: ribosome biogenesis factor YjgA [Woeseiaceae bacterium]
MTIDKPSKTERKREQQALQELGEYLIPLKSKDLDSIGLNDELLTAVRAAAKMKSHGALRRQKQLIGKLMRQADADLIRERLDKLGARERAEKILFAKAERWRDSLLRDGPQALQKFAEATGDEDDELQQLLADLANTINERSEKTLKRQVFRRVHAILVRISQ